MTTLLISGNGVELDQFLNHRFFTVTLNSFWDTGTQLSLQDDGLEFFEGLTYCIGLTQDVNTLHVLLHHLVNAYHVPFDVREPFQDIRLAFFLHLLHSFHASASQGG